MADSLQSLIKPPGSAESDGDLDQSVYTTPKEQREQERKRVRISEEESPNPADKQRLKFEEESPLKEHSDSIQKVQKAAKVTTSPFLSTDMAQSTDVLVDKPSGIKPYRDYLDPLYKLPYEQERNLQCATVNYTHDKILKDINVKGEVHVASFKDLIKRHLRQEETIIFIRDKVDLEIRNKILETHSSEGESELINCKEIIEHARVSMKQNAIMTINANSNKFKSQEPSEVSTKNSMMDEVIDNAYALVAKNLLVKLQDNMQSLEYRKGDEGNATRKVILQCGNPFLLTVTEVVTASVRTGTGAGDREEAYDFVRYAMSTEQAKADEVAKKTATINNVISQVAALTCAVAEKFQESDDKKLRIRNLDSVITAPTDYSGTKEAKAEARKKREDQFKNWLDNLTGKDNFKPAYSFYLIDPQKNDSRQKVTAILTVSLEQDKYRIEQLISKERGSSRDKPSSQRYTGQDPAAFNIPKFSVHLKQDTVLVRHRAQEPAQEQGGKQKHYQGEA